ncbi:MAG: hypothetical protein ACFE0P_04385 [Oceanicaulis sp.]
MIGFDPYAPRLPRSVPAGSSSRVTPGGGAGASGDPDRRALIPSGPRRTSSQPRRRASDRPGETARAAARAGLTLQTDAPAPRRGLRADSCEQGRYRRAYEAAMTPADPGPRLEKRA